MMSRWEGIKRDYTPAEVEKLRGSVRIEYSLARNGANRLWKQLNESGDENWVAALDWKSSRTTS
jgi:isocitrate lyase